MTFTGKVSGTDHADLVKKAREIAATYYGTECVDVRLSDETAEDEPYTVTSRRIVFYAAFEAQESHQVEARSYGPDVCVTCNRQSWPQNPLPVARWGKTK